MKLPFYQWEFFNNLNYQFGIISIKKLPLVIQNFQMRSLILLFFLLTGILRAQSDSTFVDTKYLEDQLYANVTYIKMLSMPGPISQTGFSYGFGLGLIKDLPVNKSRNIGFGLGLGYALNSFYFSVKEIAPKSLENESIVYRSNKVTTHNVEVPVEFRFRTSTPKKYKFWRVYPGFKFSYIFAVNTKLGQREGFDVKDIIEVNKFQYGPTLSIGYNKWNFYVYYGLSEMFSNTENNSYKIGIHDLRLGLIFYIL
jgi:hypothetical protein